MKQPPLRRAEAFWYEPRKRWQINAQKHGQRKTFTSKIAGKRGKHAAEAKADKWLETFQTQQRFKAAWEAFAQYKQSRIDQDKLAKSTWIRYETNARLHILPHMHNAPLNEITVYDWQTCLDAAAAQGLAEGTLGLIRTVIMMFCTYAIGRNWEIILPPKSALSIDAGKPAKPRRALKQSELHALLSAANKDSHYICAFQFLVLTGLRRGECIALEPADIDRAKSKAVISRAYNRELELNKGKTKKAARSVALQAAAIELLDMQRAYLKRLGIISKYVFPDEFGNIADPASFSRSWRSLAKKLNIGCTLHELRHTFISIVKSDMPLSLLKQNVGHSVNMDTYATYGHEIEGDSTTTAAIIEQSFQTRANLPRKNVYQRVYRTSLTPTIFPIPA